MGQLFWQTTWNGAQTTNPNRNIAGKKNIKSLPVAFFSQKTFILPFTRVPKMAVILHGKKESKVTSGDGDPYKSLKNLTLILPFTRIKWLVFKIV